MEIQDTGQGFYLTRHKDKENISENIDQAEYKADAMVLCDNQRTYIYKLISIYEPKITTQKTEIK